MDQPPVPRKAPSAWTVEDDEALVSELADGASLSLIAEHLDRSEKAIRARARRMLPDDPSVPSGDQAIGWLRARLQHGHDWRAQLRQRDRPPPRSGEPWDYAEHELLVEELRQGLTWDSIAAAHGRSTSGVRSRSALMVAKQDSDGATARWRADQLRDIVLEQPDYDWLPALRRNSPQSSPLTSADVEALREAWTDSMPLPDLAGALDLSEVALVRLFRVLGLASTLTEVTDRLGCTPGGTVDVRRQIAADPATVVLAVLVGSDETGVHHVSLHPSITQAEAAKEALTAESDGGTGSWNWRVWSRYLSDLDARGATAGDPDVLNG